MNSPQNLWGPTFTRPPLPSNIGRGPARIGGLFWRPRLTRLIKGVPGSCLGGIWGDRCCMRTSTWRGFVWWQPFFNAWTWVFSEGYVASASARDMICLLCCLWCLRHSNVTCGCHLVTFLNQTHNIMQIHVRPKPHESQRKFHNFLQHGTFVFEKSSFPCFSP